MSRRLLTECPGAAEDWFWGNYSEDMGGEMTIYRRVSQRVFPEPDMIMTPEDREALRGKSRWMAECDCTACGDTWYTAWHGGGAVSVIIGEDGEVYPDYDPESPEPGTRVMVTEGDGLACPMCGTDTSLKRAASISKGMVRRRWFTAIDSVEGFTVVYYWMACRRVDSGGWGWREIAPWNAYVLAEDGRLKRYIFRDGGWKPSTNCNDAAWIKYVSGDSISTYHHTVGGWDWTDVPSQVGKTGERTGVAAYMRAGGTYPVAYLKTWRHHWQLCKLAESPFARLLDEMIREEYDRYKTRDLRLEGLDLAKTKHYQMLRMDRQSYRQLIQTGAEHWGLREHQAWLRYAGSGGCCSAAEFDGYWCRFGAGGFEAVMEARRIYPWLDLPRLGRYLDQQRELHKEAPAPGVEMLMDTWRMMTVLYGRELRTDEELWPGDLEAKHDSMEAAYKIMVGTDSALAMKCFREFTQIREELKELEWTDGELRIVIPWSNLDLIREGAVLRHCVDGYADHHISGQQRIFFVRRYRRPERSYYTLSVSMVADQPVQRQLHGYGNEKHGPRKTIPHKMDKRIQPFVDRWMREVLMPWWRKRQQEEKKEGRTA